MEDHALRLREHHKAPITWERRTCIKTEETKASKRSMTFDKIGVIEISLYYSGKTKADVPSGMCHIFYYGEEKLEAAIKNVWIRITYSLVFIAAWKYFLLSFYGAHIVFFPWGTCQVNMVFGWLC